VRSFGADREKLERIRKYFLGRGYEPVGPNGKNVGKAQSEATGYGPAAKPQRIFVPAPSGGAHYRLINRSTGEAVEVNEWSITTWNYRNSSPGRGKQETLDTFIERIEAETRQAQPHPMPMGPRFVGPQPSRRRSRRGGQP